MLTLKELALKIGAEYRGSDIPVPCFSIDSRTLQKNDVFVALRAERDGHQFLENAIARGAGAILVDHAQQTDIPQIIVKDTLMAFGQLAHVWRSQFKIPIIGITGSCGKTTTKEMIATILGEQGDTLASEGTYNNAYGVPLTLLRLRPHHQFAVIEMGTNSPGEIAYLAEITAPTVALITNIGGSHLEKLGDFAGVSKEKSDIFTYLAEQGIAILNKDEPFMESWYQKIGKRHRLTYSMADTADVFATNIHYNSDHVNFELHTPLGIQPIAIPLPGNHIAVNAVAAATACLAIGIPLEKIAQGLTKMQSVAGRFKRYVLRNGCILIDDSYNSSINAVKNAIETLKLFPGRKVIALTSLKELGSHAPQYHTDLGKWCHAAGFDAVYFYGNAEMLQYALKECPSAQYYDNKAELTKKMGEEARPDTMILIKGANSFKMHEIIDALLEDNQCVV